MKTTTISLLFYLIFASSLLAQINVETTGKVSVGLSHSKFLG